MPSKDLQCTPATLLIIPTSCWDSKALKWYSGPHTLTRSYGFSFCCTSKMQNDQSQGILYTYNTTFSEFCCWLVQLFHFRIPISAVVWFVPLHHRLFTWPRYDALFSSLYQILPNSHYGLLVWCSGFGGDPSALMNCPGYVWSGWFVKKYASQLCTHSVFKFSPSTFLCKILLTGQAYSYSWLCHWNPSFSASLWMVGTASQCCVLFFLSYLPDICQLNLHQLSQISLTVLLLLPLVSVCSWIEIAIINEYC